MLPDGPVRQPYSYSAPSPHTQIVLKFQHWIVETLALIVRCSNYSARSHPLLGQLSSKIRLDLIHNSARSHQQLCQISSTTRLDLMTFRQIPFTDLARSHPQLGQIYPQLGQISSTARLDLIHFRLDPIHILGQISSTTQLDLIHNSARSHPHTRLQISSTYSAISHPQLGQISSTDSARSHPQLGQISSTDSARSHPPLGYISSTARLNLIHTAA